jgi:hypothetical protein
MPLNELRIVSWDVPEADELGLDERRLSRTMTLSRSGKDTRLQARRASSPTTIDDEEVKLDPWKKSMALWLV